MRDRIGIFETLKKLIKIVKLRFKKMILCWKWRVYMCMYPSFENIYEEEHKFIWMVLS